MDFARGITVLEAGLLDGLTWWEDRILLTPPVSYPDRTEENRSYYRRNRERRRQQARESYHRNKHKRSRA